MLSSSVRRSHSEGIPVLTVPRCRKLGFISYKSRYSVLFLIGCGFLRANVFYNLVNMSSLEEFVFTPYKRRDVIKWKVGSCADLGLSSANDDALQLSLSKIRPPFFCASLSSGL